ncbi:chorismate-binding protein, partial [Robiginitalea sp.]|uniref:chorismate-binding protein n=1 Tax=Robiginitalea sp. TaxID=1902411 RepID=UPI003C6A7BB0
MPNKKKRKALFGLLRDHYGRNLPFVLYKKPWAQQINALLQSDKSLHSTLDFERPGFVMAPFDHNQGDAPLVFLKPDAFYQCKYKPAKDPIRHKDPVRNPVGREIHLDLVTAAKKSIEADSLEKVVVSRRFSIPMTSDLFNTAHGMMQSYPTAFTYLFHHPGVGTWMGATPELLLESSKGLGQTLSLAGTRAADPTLKRYEWTSKELHEQGVVTDFITDQMRALELDPEIGPLTNTQAGKL